jgi:hypothetical protein
MRLSHGTDSSLTARIGKVQNILHLLLFVAAVVDVIGMIYVVTR